MTMLVQSVNRMPSVVRYPAPNGFKTDLCQVCEAKSSLPVSPFPPKPPSEQPYYLCTVTCCNSANCVQSNGLRPLPSRPLWTEVRDPNCAICAKTLQGKQTRTVILSKVTRGSELDNIVHSLDQQQPNKSPTQSIQSPVFKDEVRSPSVRRSLRRESLNRNPKLQMYNSRTVQSPELSSSPQGNSSFTEYTDTYTPMCTSANSNRTECSPAFKFNLEESQTVPPLPGPPPHSPHSSEYQFYFTANVDNHGFFRKAVPALPIAVAVLFCILNLIIPGSGTLLASVMIMFGSQTEYGSGHECRAFFICFLSAILQFITAIVVFGWVWSIMWGIVFIKNSLRYGEKRTIYTMSLC